MKRLLILEDDNMLREILRESFRERGYAVRDLASLKAWKREGRDFVPTHAILDLKLASESGYEHEREYTEKILQDVSGNVSRAARVLGIHRQSLQRKLRKYT